MPQCQSIFFITFTIYLQKFFKRNFWKFLNFIGILVFLENLKLFIIANLDCEGGEGGCCSNINNSLGDGDSVIRRAKVEISDN